MKFSLQTYQFKSGEVIASLGCGGGLWEVGFAAQVAGLTFYLEEISEELINPTELSDAIEYWQKFTSQTIDSTFHIQIGTETSTGLPDDFFDKVLIINALHEFSFPEKMLDEAFRILKKEGVFFIEEQLAQSPNQIHEGCGKILFQEKELIQLAESKGFSLVQIAEREPFKKILSFKKQ